MPMPNLIDFYRRNIPNPNAKPFKQETEWTTGVTTEYDVNPQTNEQILVSAIDLRVPRDLDLNSSKLEIQGYPDGAGGTKLILGSLDDILQQSDEVVHDDSFPTVEEIKVRFKPEPPIMLTDAGAEIIKFKNDTSEAQAFTGFIKFTVHGWFLNENDY